MAGAIEVRIENQLVRFVPPSPVDQASVVAQLGGQQTGGVVIKVLDRPRATLVIDQAGRIVVHGTHRVEAARAAAKELMLRLGLRVLDTFFNDWICVSSTPVCSRILPAKVSMSA